MKPILLIGAGGHCKSILDTILRAEAFEIGAIVDQKDVIGKEVLGYQVAYTDENLEALFNKGIHDACMAVGGIGDCTFRKRLYRHMKSIGFKFPIICDPSAIVSPFAQIGEGTFIGKGSIINAGATIGEMAIINTASVIEHDCKVGRFTFLAPRAVLLGGVVVGEESHIGSGAIVRENIRVGSRCMIGMGSVVVRGIQDDAKAYGNPCKEVGLNE